jgi:hypothetical protein
MGASERSASQHQRANGASSGRIGDARETDFRPAVDGHRGYERNADASTHQSKQARELSALENDLRRDARTIAGSDGVFAETMAVTQKEKWLLAKFA